MKHVFIAAAVALVSLSAQAQDGAPEKAQICFSCHGPAGAKPILPEYPILAGQYANYLEQSLREYKTGKRKNPVMSAQTANMSEADIVALARWFSEQPTTLYTPMIPGKPAQ